MAETMLPVLVGSSVVALALQSRVLYLVVTGLGCYALLNGAMVGFEGPAENAFVFGMALAGLVVKLYNYMYLIEPDKLQRKTAGDAVLSDDCRVGKLHEASSSPNLVAKALRVRSTLWDAFELVISSRGIGWKFELRGLFQASDVPTSRLGFAFEQAWGAFWRFVVMDVVRQMLMTTHLAGLHPLLGPLDYPFWTKVALGALLCQWVRWKMELPYRVASAAGVLIGWGRASEWPPIFNSWSNAWTIRRFWSHSWHQNLRMQTEPPTTWLIDDVMKAKRGSYLSRYGRVCGIFFMAFLIHGYGRILTGGSPWIDFCIFMMQPVLIFTEDAFKGMVSRSGIVSTEHWSATYAGYAWVLIVESLVMAFWMDELVRKGMFREPVFGLTLVEHFRSCEALKFA